MFSRRSLVAGLAGATLVGSRSAAARNADYDIVVVGAGAAGMAAGRALARSNRTFLVLEARERVGGRAYTDVSGLGHPFDCGAHWLHLADQNRLAAMARRQGYRLTPSSREATRLFASGRLASSAEHRAFHDAIEHLEAAGAQRLGTGLDMPIANLATGDRTLAQALIVPAIEMAEEPGRLSLVDYASLGKGRDLLVEGGLGTYIATLADGLPIRLNTPVETIFWGGAGVELSGNFGRLVAKACIITIPTQVLAGGGVRFNPPLPSRTAQALDDLPLGVMNKIGVRLSVPFDIEAEYVVDPHDIATGRWQVVHVSRDRRIATLLVVGDHARALSAEGLNAMEAFAGERLRSLFGSKLRLEHALSTTWDRDPYAKGAYSHARVGAAQARSIYAEPVAGRLFFAGEASAGPQAVTVGGAYVSGTVAAGAVLEAIRSER